MGDPHKNGIIKEGVKKPELSIVIVNWNTEQLLKNCLDSIYENRGELDLELFVVDNASSDGSVEMIHEQFPKVNLIANSQNVGFAVANNQAFPLCTSELILMLNSDTRVVGNALTIMTTFLHEHPEVGAIGPKIIHPSMRLRVLSCGNQPTLRTMFNQYSGLSALFPHVPFFEGINLFINVHDEKVRSVEWISGACLMTRRTVLEQVGGLDERWFMYAEDMEWCRRVQAHSWQLCSVPQSVIEHHMGASTAKNKKVSTMWLKSLRTYFVSNEAPSRIQLLLFDLILAFGMGSRAFYYMARGLVDSKRRTVWWDEGRKFVLYTREACLQLVSMTSGIFFS